jgi:hypothetical protein
LTGPNSAEWIPRKASAANISVRLCSQNPARPTIMIAISKSLIHRMSRDFSTLSAICPEVADSSTNGAMNTAPARLTSAFGSSVVNRAAWKATKMISAFL